MDQQAIDKLIDQILSQAGIKEVSPEFLDNYKIKFKKEIEKIISKTIILNLPDNKLDDFTELAQQSDPNPEEVEKFLKENIKDYPEVLAKELKKFEDIFLSKVKK